MHLRKTIAASGNPATSDSVVIEVRIAGLSNTYSSALSYFPTNISTHETAWGITAIRANVEKELFRVGAGTNGVFIGSDTTGTSTRVGIAYNGSSGYGLVLPSAQGSSGQTLQNDGSGNLSWATVAGAKEMIAKRKTADESVTSSTTLQDDNHLVWAASANKNYVFRYFIPYTIASGTGIKINITAPSGATGSFATLVASGGAAYAAASAQSTAIGTTLDIPGLNVSTGATHLVVEGYIDVSSTAGNVTLQFAQSTSNATALVFKATATLIVHEV